MMEDGAHVSLVIDPPDPPQIIAAVNIKLPPFWPSDPEVWFAQVEAQFTTRGITVERTKFDHIVAALSPDTAMEVRDLILTPPASAPYTTLKKVLIKRTAGSHQQRLQKLLNEVELGDRKPSQLLRRMRQLWTSDDTDNVVLRELFIQRLPSNVRMVLAPSGSSVSLDNLAEMADRIMEVTTPTVAAMHSPPTPPSEVEVLRSHIRDLQEQVKSLSMVNRSPRRRSPTPARRRSPSPAYPSSVVDHTLCWYHQRFGNAATKCKPPCSRAPNAPAAH